MTIKFLDLLTASPDENLSSHTGETGETWAASSHLTVTSTGVFANAGSAAYSNTYIPDTDTYNIEFKCVREGTATATTNSSNMALMFLHQDDNNWFWVRWGRAGFDIFRKLAGSVTSEFTSTSYGVKEVTYTCRIEINPSTVTVFVDNVQVYQDTAATAINRQSVMRLYATSAAEGSGGTHKYRDLILYDGVNDTTHPTVFLNGGSTVNHANGQPWVDPGAYAVDLQDGVVSNSVNVSGTVDVNTNGVYTLDYTVTDSSGNVSAVTQRTVNVGIIGNAPEITLTGASTVSVLLGGSYTELGATASDVEDGDITGSIVIDSSAVNVNAVGSYPVTYNVTDSDGNPAAQVTRTVNVVASSTSDATITITGIPDGTYRAVLLDESDTVFYNGDAIFVSGSSTLSGVSVIAFTAFEGFIIDNADPHQRGAVVTGVTS